MYGYHAKRLITKCMVSLVFCAAHGAAQDLQTRYQREIYFAKYVDGSGQHVSTLGAKSWFSINPNWSTGVKLLGDYISMDAMHHTSHSDTDSNVQTTEHQHDAMDMDADAISGASGLVHAKHADGKGRGEIAWLLRRDLHGTDPVSIASSMRYSGESDFHSIMGTLSTHGEFFDRNTSISGYMGWGMDISDPSQPPPGESDSWPGQSERISMGFALGQLLNSRIQIGISYAISGYMGVLENPYRRAVVISTLFPEELPNLRVRQVAGFEIGAYMGAGIALFHRQGLTLDSWGSKGWLYESKLPIELGTKWLFTPGHRYFYQTKADFYKPLYTYKENWMTGDSRLGQLEGNEWSAELDYTIQWREHYSHLALSLVFDHQMQLITGKAMESMIVSVIWRQPVF